MNWIRNHVVSYVRGRELLDENPLFQDINFSELDELVLNNAPGGWSIDRKVAELLMALVAENDISRVVEIGAGFSTIVFHYCLTRSRKEYEVFSIEENVEWFKIPNELKELIDHNLISFITGRVGFTFGEFGFHAGYQVPAKKNLKKGVELVFVDGPQYYYGREGALDGIYEKLKVGCLIVMDDAERYTEQCVIYKWLKVYQGLQLIYFEEKFGDKGLAILEVKTPLKKKFSVNAFLLGLMQGTKRLLNYKSIREKQNYLKSEEGP